MKKRLLKKMETGIEGPRCRLVKRLTDKNATSKLRKYLKKSPDGIINLMFETAAGVTYPAVLAEDHHVLSDGRLFLDVMTSGIIGDHGLICTTEFCDYDINVPFTAIHRLEVLCSW
jgi:hypothetical protein